VLRIFLCTNPAERGLRIIGDGEEAFVGVSGEELTVKIFALDDPASRIKRLQEGLDTQEILDPLTRQGKVFLPANSLKAGEPRSPLER